jgi:hypothetical protein
MRINCEDESQCSFGAQLGRAPRAKAGIFHYRMERCRGLVAVIAGVFAGSISLVGFGIDSFIERFFGLRLLVWKGNLVGFLVSTW